MITTKKSQLEVFFLTLKGTEGVLSLADSRIRDSFLKPLTEATQTFEQDRKVIYERFCTKDSNGDSDLSDNQYKFPKDILEEMNKELEILCDEEVALEAPEGLKEIMEKTEYKPKTGEVEIIDQILELL